MSCDRRFCFSGSFASVQGPATVGSRSISITGSSQTVTRRHTSRPAGDEGHAHAALEGRQLALAQRLGAPGVIAVAEEGAVVGEEDHQRVALDAAAFDRVENLAHGPVKLLHDIAIEPCGRFAAKRVGGEDRHVRHHVRHVEEERAAFVALDEARRPLGEAPRELALIGIGLDDLQAVVKGQGRHLLRQRGVKLRCCRSSTGCREIHRSHAAAD
jgi:hypothetical protein